MRIAVALETDPGETRVAMVPTLLGSLIDLGYEVLLEPGAGAAAEHPDAEYVAAGAVIAADALARADVVLGVEALDPDRVAQLRAGCAQISFLPRDAAVLDALRAAHVTAFAMDLVPRISRAQPMDALTSQSLVVGYRGAVVAAGLLRRFFPQTITAAGTVPAAEVVVLGAGVAGLQAIATARRLGAHVRAYDVRASSAEEIASMGAEYLDLGLPPLDGPSGYAREMSDGRAARQRTLLAPHVARADALITTAAVPGRRAPVLVTTAMIAAMKPGSVVVDLAAESGGNVEGSRPGEIIRVGGVQVWGGANVAGQLPGHASELYAQNVLAMLRLMTVGDGTFAPDFTDEIVGASAVTHAGEILHGTTASSLSEQ